MLSFPGVIGGEWRKLRKQRSFVWATATAIAVCFAISALAGSLLEDEWGADPSEALLLTASMPATGAYLAGLIFGLGVCVWLAGEFVSGSNYLTLMAVPRRRTVFLARLTLVGILALVLGGTVATIGAASALAFVGPGVMSEVMATGDFWASIGVTILVSASTVLLFFATATLTRRSLPAVGLVAVLFFVVPGLAAYASLLGGSGAVSQVLGLLPGSLVSDVLAASSEDVASKLPSMRALLLLMWDLLFVILAAWRFTAQE